MVNFKNGSTPLNDTNLNKMQTDLQSNIDNLEPVILYNNSSGTTGTVTLSETAANFNYIEIFAVRDTLRYSTRVYKPNNRTVALTTSCFVDNHIYLYSKVVKISGTSITVNYNKLGYFGSSDQSVGDDDKHKIYLVLGYK